MTDPNLNYQLHQLTLAVLQLSKGTTEAVEQLKRLNELLTPEPPAQRVTPEQAEQLGRQAAALIERSRTMWEENATDGEPS